MYPDSNWIRNQELWGSGFVKMLLKVGQILGSGSDPFHTVILSNLKKVKQFFYNISIYSLKAYFKKLLCIKTVSCSETSTCHICHKEYKDLYHHVKVNYIFNTVSYKNMIGRKNPTFFKNQLFNVNKFLL